MKTNHWVLTLWVAVSCTGGVIAQDKLPAPPARTVAPIVHEPPPQAYADCKGKKAGDAIQHTTREGKVAAMCEDSPKGLVARPIQPKGSPPEGRAN